MFGRQRNRFHVWPVVNPLLVVAVSFFVKYFIVQTLAGHGFVLRKAALCRVNVSLVNAIRLT